MSEEELTGKNQTQSQKEEKNSNSQKIENLSPSLAINTEATESKGMGEKKFLGFKRRLFKKKKEKKEQKLLISKQKDYFINNSSSFTKNNNECIICLEKISLRDRHFLHCGHFFHCDCINKWLSMDKNKCPLCKQNIECYKSALDDSSIDFDIHDEILGTNHNREICTKGQLTIVFVYFWILTVFYFMTQ